MNPTLGAHRCPRHRIMTRGRNFAHGSHGSRSNHSRTAVLYGQGAWTYYCSHEDHVPMSHPRRKLSDRACVHYEQNRSFPLPFPGPGTRSVVVVNAVSPHSSQQPYLEANANDLTPWRIESTTGSRVRATVSYFCLPGRVCHGCRLISLVYRFSMDVRWHRPRKLTRVERLTVRRRPSRLTEDAMGSHGSWPKSFGHEQQPHPQAPVAPDSHGKRTRRPWLTDHARVCPDRDPNFRSLAS